MATASTTFSPRISLVDPKQPRFRENELAWERIVAQFDDASAEASKESKSSKAIDNHTSKQLLGKTVVCFCYF
jgi:hypothetical protein